MRRLPAFTALLILLGASPQQDSLSEQIDRLIEAAGLKNTRVCIEIHSTITRKPVYQRDADAPARLASNAKLFTAAAALDLLGPDHTFVTEVHLERDGEGKPVSLIVTGDGDPNISGRLHGDNPTALFEGWADALITKNIKSIPGGITLVTDKFEPPAYPPGWRDYPKDAWWSALPAQFTLNDGCVDIVYETGKKAGVPVTLTLRPKTEFVTLKNNSHTVRGKGKTAFQFNRKPGTNEIRVKGDLAIGTKPTVSWIAVDDPHRYFATVLRETLQRKNIDIGGDIRMVTQAPEKLERIARFESRLDQTLQICLNVSQNVYAELVLLHLGWKAHGRGTRENGLRVVNDFLKKSKIEGVLLQDGSGLTPENRASASAVAALLQTMTKHEHAKVFQDSLAVNGAEKGTLRKRLKKDEYRGRVRAKTGHLEGVSTLSGYLLSKEGAPRVFSILIDGSSASAKGDRLQDQICELLLNRP